MCAWPPRRGARVRGPSMRRPHACSRTTMRSVSEGWSFMMAMSCRGASRHSGAVCAAEHDRRSLHATRAPYATQHLQQGRRRMHAHTHTHTRVRTSLTRAWRSATAAAASAAAAAAAASVGFARAASMLCTSCRSLLWSLFSAVHVPVPLPLAGQVLCVVATRYARAAMPRRQAAGAQLHHMPAPSPHQGPSTAAPALGPLLLRPRQQQALPRHRLAAQRPHVRRRAAAGLAQQQRVLLALVLQQHWRQAVR